MAHLPPLLLLLSSFHDGHDLIPWSDGRGPRLCLIRRNHLALSHPYVLSRQGRALCDPQVEYVRPIYGAILFYARHDCIRIH